MAYAKLHNKPSEVHTKERNLRIHIVPALGHLRLDQIGSEQADKFASAQLEAGYSAKTINNHLAILSKMLGLAAERHKITRSPKVELLRVASQDPVFLTFGQADKLVDATDDGIWRTMVIVALKTGLRLGELRALRWSDVDLDRGLLRVTQNAWERKADDQEIGMPKSNKTREVPMPSPAIDALRKHRHLRGPLVFCDNDGSILTHSACEWAMDKAVRRAGLPCRPTKKERRAGHQTPDDVVGWHTMRHTFASHLVMRGAQLKAVQEILGHSTIQMTMRYAHLSPDVRRDAVKLLDEPSGSKLETSGRRSDTT